jgi:methylated-DNA-[protein]-cysteine S-methyltransferase
MIEPLAYCYTDCSTPFGTLAMVWRSAGAAPRVRQIFLCGRRPAETVVREAYPQAEPGSAPEIGSLAGRVKAYFGGENVRFDLSLCELERCADFQRRVLRAEYAIPRGRVSTYGRIAAHLGAPRAGRAVGRALAENPFPILIPCHRAVRSDGALGGYQGGPSMKRALLEMEGVPFDKGGRVAVRSFHYS